MRLGNRSASGVAITALAFALSGCGAATPGIDTPTMDGPVATAPPSPSVDTQTGLTGTCTMGYTAQPGNFNGGGNAAGPFQTTPPAVDTSYGETLVDYVAARLVVTNNDATDAQLPNVTLIFFDGSGNEITSMGSDTGGVIAAGQSMTFLLTAHGDTPSPPPGAATCRVAQ